MIDIEFQFQDSYMGFWEIPDNPSNNLSGTLFLDKRSIWIELAVQGFINLPHSIKYAQGTVFTKNKEKNIEEYYSIVLQDLTIQKSWGQTNLAYYKYEIRNVFICEGKPDFDNVGEISIRSSIFDDWVSTSSKETIQAEESNPNKIIFKYNRPESIELFNTNDIRLYLFPAYNYQYSQNSLNLKLHTFLCIKQNIPSALTDFMPVVIKYKYLFYLITHVVFEIDFMLFFSSSGKFLYKQNEKYLYRCMDSISANMPHTVLSDFAVDELNAMFIKWNTFYDSYVDAIDMFFEAESNLYLSPALKLRSLVSVIDAFSHDMRGDASEYPVTKRTKQVMEFLDKAKEVLSKDEINKLKMWSLPQKGKELKTRFNILVQSIRNLLPTEIDESFINKTVDYRHGITHLGNNDFRHSKESELDDIAYNLTKVIRAYMLNQIGVREEKIVELIKF